MFTTDTQALIDRAKDVATSRGESQLTISALATSLAMDPHGARLLSQCLSMDQAELRRRFPAPDPLQTCAGKLTLVPEVREMLALAKTFVAKLPSTRHPSLIALSHLAVAVARSLPPAQHTGIKLPSEERVLQLLAGWMEEETRPPSLGDLTRRLRALRNELLQRVYGQDHAVYQFMQGLFNIEAVGDTDTERRKPAGLFVFAGPPGVGKTFLAELGASHLDRPFMRFDMSAYAHGHEAVGLTEKEKEDLEEKKSGLTDDREKQDVEDDIKEVAEKVQDVEDDIKEVAEKVKKLEKEIGDATSKDYNDQNTIRERISFGEKCQDYRMAVWEVFKEAKSKAGSESDPAIKTFAEKQVKEWEGEERGHETAIFNAKQALDKCRNML